MLCFDMFWRFEKHHLKNVLLESKKPEELGDVQLGHLPTVSGYSNGEYS